MQVWNNPIDIFWQVITASGLNNIYVAKVNSWGTLQWLKYTTTPNTKKIEIWGIDTDEVGNIALNGFLDGSGNVFGQWLISTGAYEEFQAKLSSTGGLMWARKTDGWWANMGIKTAKLAIDSQNNIVTTSSFSGIIYESWSILTSSGWVDTLLSKLTPGGIHYDSLFYVKNGWGWVSDDYGKAISIDSQWNRYLWWEFSGSTVKVFSSTLNGSWWYDIFLSKIDQYDNIVWTKKAWGVNFEEIIALQSNSAWVYVGWNFYGYTWGTTLNLFWQNMSWSWDLDGFISKVSSTGWYIWNKKMGWTWVDKVSSIALDPTWNIYVAGSFIWTWIQIFSWTYSSSWFDDAYVAKLNSGGTVSWVVKGWGTGSDSVQKIVYHPDGSIYVLWQYYSYNPPFLNGTGSPFEWRTAWWNIYVARLNATTGQSDWSMHIGGDNSDVPLDIAISSTWSVYVLGAFKDQLCYLNNTINCPSALFGWIDWNYWGTFLALLNGTWSQINSINNYWMGWKQLLIDQDNAVILVDRASVSAPFWYDFLSISWSSDIVYAKINSWLSPEWVKIVNSVWDEQLSNTIVDNRNNIELIWYYTGAMSYWGNNSTTYWGYDAFTIRLSTNDVCEPQICTATGTYYGYTPVCDSLWCTSPGVSEICSVYIDKCSLIADWKNEAIPDVDCDAGWGGGGWGGPF
jgi:hypothetical protein